jgi:intracellular sulfur oxidation DsrE/DsrF family protein
VKTIDPEVKGKVETLMTGGMKMGACQITMKRQNIKPEELIEGLPPIPSGVVRVMELQEKGYAYIKP